jgi:hypothetical protein
MHMAKAAGFTPAPTVRIAAEQEPISLGPPLAPPFDPLGILPPGAAEKLRTLRLRASEAHALVVPFSEQQDLSTERLKAEQRLKRLLDPAQNDGFNLKDDDARVVTQKKLVAKLTDDLKRLIERGEARAAAWRSASGALASCETWLRDGRPRGVQLQDHEAEPVKLAKGESLIDAIESRRRRVTELRADLEKISAAPIPSSYAKQQARAQIDALASRGAVNVRLLVERDGKIEFPMTQVRAMVHNATPGAVAYHDAVDVVGLLAFVLRPTLTAAIDHLIDEAADDRSALTPEARQLRMAEVQSHLLDIERQEAWLTWAAMDERLPAEHRPDVNPLALLDLMLVATPRVTVTSETSPEWVTTYAGL